MKSSENAVFIGLFTTFRNARMEMKVGLIADYASYTAKYADFVTKFSKWESENLNDAEKAYYIDVQTRVNNRLMEVEF